MKVVCFLTCLISGPAYNENVTRMKELRQEEAERGRGRKEVNMKIQNISDIDGFFKQIDQCKGKVELVTDEGDRLNLKSKLSQYVSLAKIFADNKIPEMELVVYDPEDTIQLMNFMAGDASKEN